MFNRRLPSCVCMSAVTKVAVPTVLGTILTMAIKIPRIIKIANDVKNGIESGMKFVADVKSQSNNNPDQIEEVKDNMG